MKIIIIIVKKLIKLLIQDYKKMIWDCYKESKSLFHIQRIFLCVYYMNYRKFFDEERDINVILY